MWRNFAEFENGCKGAKNERFEIYQELRKHQVFSLRKTPAMALILVIILSLVGGITSQNSHKWRSRVESLMSNSAERLEFWTYVQLIYFHSNQLSTGHR